MQTTDASGTPTRSTDPPQLKVWDDTPSIVDNVLMPIVDQYIDTGMFVYQLFLGSDYVTGQYNFTVHYAVSTDYKVETGSFEIVPGGDADGHRFGMYFYDRPNADFIVQQTQSGKIKKGRGPNI